MIRRACRTRQPPACRLASGLRTPPRAASFDAASKAFDALSAEQSTPFTHVLPAELAQSTFAARGAPVGVVVLANAQQRVLFDGKDAKTADQTMRQIIASGAFAEDACAAMWAMEGATMRRVSLSGTTTQARELGATLRMARENRGDDPVEAGVEYLHGSLLMRGRIVDSSEQTGGGFDAGVVTIEAADGKTLRIINQNENMLAWPVDSKAPVVMAPDLICFMTVDGQPFSNADLDLAKNKEVAVISAPVAKDYAIQRSSTRSSRSCAVPVTAGLTSRRRERHRDGRTREWQLGGGDGRSPSPRSADQFAEVRTGVAAGVAGLVVVPRLPGAEAAELRAELPVEPLVDRPGGEQRAPLGDPETAALRKRRFLGSGFDGVVPFGVERVGLEVDGCEFGV